MTTRNIELDPPPLAIVRGAFLGACVSVLLWLLLVGSVWALWECCS